MKEEFIGRPLCPKSKSAVGLEIFRDCHEPIEYSYKGKYLMRFGDITIHACKHCGQVYVTKMVGDVNEQVPDTFDNGK